jgi:hypothetical protein
MCDIVERLLLSNTLTCGSSVQNEEKECVNNLFVAGYSRGILTMCFERGRKGSQGRRSRSISRASSDI